MMLDISGLLCLCHDVHACIYCFMIRLLFLASLQVMQGAPAPGAWHSVVPIWWCMPTTVHKARSRFPTPNTSVSHCGVELCVHPHCSSEVRNMAVSSNRQVLPHAHGPSPASLLAQTSSPRSYQLLLQSLAPSAVACASSE